MTRPNKSFANFYQRVHFRCCNFVDVLRSLSFIPQVVRPTRDTRFFELKNTGSERDGFRRKDVSWPCKRSYEGSKTDALINHDDVPFTAPQRMGKYKNFDQNQLIEVEEAGRIIPR